MRTGAVRVLSVALLMAGAFGDSALAQDTAAEISVLKENINENKKNSNRDAGFVINSDKCDVRLIGKIGAGTAKKFQNIYEDDKNELNSNTILMCLDSTGGEVAEALAIARFIRMHQRPAITTVVQNGAFCQSACALVFLAGTEPARLGPSSGRLLQPLGKLMLHSTYFRELSDANSADLLKGENGQKVLAEFYKRGLRDIQQIVEAFRDSTYTADFVGKPFVSPSLFLEVFSQAPDEWVCIDTIDKAGRWNIQLEIDPSSAPSKRKYYNLCRNTYFWARDENADNGKDNTPGDVAKIASNRTIGGRNRSSVDFYPKDFFERFLVDVDFAMKASKCVVEVGYADRKKEVVSQLKVFFVYSSGELASGIYDADTSGFFDPDTPIAELAKGKKETANNAGMETAAVSMPAFSKYENRKMASCELRRVKDVDIAGCETSCARDRDCAAFSYNKSARLCSIKHTSTALRLDPLWQTGIRPGFTRPQDSIRSSTMDEESWSMLKGKVLDMRIAPSFEQCAEYCEGDERCLGVTFVGSANQCRRFESIDSIGYNNSDFPPSRSGGVEVPQSSVKRQK